MTSIERYVGQSIYAVAYAKRRVKECRSWVYEPRRSKISSSKKLLASVNTMLLGKRNLLLGVCGGGGGGGSGYIFMWWAKHLTTPPIPLEKNSRPPPHPRYMTKMFVTPPPPTSPQTPLFLSCCFKWGVIYIARYHIPKLYSDILSVAKLYSISAVEWADN